MYKEGMLRKKPKKSSSIGALNSYWVVLRYKSLALFKNQQNAKPHVHIVLKGWTVESSSPVKKDSPSFSLVPQDTSKYSPYVFLSDHSRRYPVMLVYLVISCSSRRDVLCKNKGFFFFVFFPPSLQPISLEVNQSAGNRKRVLERTRSKTKKKQLPDRSSRCPCLAPNFRVHH